MDVVAVCFKYFNDFFSNYLASFTHQMMLLFWFAMPPPCKKDQGHQYLENLRSSALILWNAATCYAYILCDVIVPHLHTQPFSLIGEREETTGLYPRTNTGNF